MATGFHGFHVLVGHIFLIVCLARPMPAISPPTQHLGFEFAAWYWHFVDVVWLFLFSASMSGATARKPWPTARIDSHSVSEREWIPVRVKETASKQRSIGRQGAAAGPPFFVWLV